MSNHHQNNGQNNHNHTRKKKNRKKTYLMIGIFVLILLIVVIFYGAYLYRAAENTVDTSYEEVERNNENNISDLREEAIDPAVHNVSILIIGVDDSDHRNNGKGRSDALLLATFNKENNDVKLLTIPRDSYVYVPEMGRYTKINHAHFYGGPKATIETVENLLNIPVDYFVRFNFEAFIEVVDSLGGINYDVPFEMYEPDSDDNKNAIHLLPGYQNLNGEEALALARTRKYDSDIERGKRQQEVIKAIVKKAASVNSILKLDDVIKAVGENMTTNLTFDEMKSFVSYGLNTDIAIESMSLTGSGGKMEDGLWYYQIDEDSKNDVEEELREHLGLMNYSK